MEKITDILLAKVEDKNGAKYGRVFELRSDGDPEHGITSENITIDPWEAIVDIKRGKIIIREP